MAVPKKLPTYDERVERFNYINEQRAQTPPVSFEKIAKALTASSGEPISRQAVHTIHKQGVVRPSGRPRKTATSDSDGLTVTSTGPQPKRKDIEARISKWTARRAAAERDQKPKKLATIDNRLSILRELLQVAV